MRATLFVRLTAGVLLSSVALPAMAGISVEFSIDSLLGRIHELPEAELPGDRAAGKRRRKAERRLERAVALAERGRIRTALRTTAAAIRKLGDLRGLFEDEIRVVVDAGQSRAASVASELADLTDAWGDDLPPRLVRRADKARARIAGAEDTLAGGDDLRYLRRLGAAVPGADRILEKIRAIIELPAGG